VVFVIAYSVGPPPLSAFHNTFALELQTQLSSFFSVQLHRFEINPVAGVHYRFSMVRGESWSSSSDIRWREAEM